MRGKGSLVVTDSRIVVFWEKEVRKISLYDSGGSKSTPIFINRTLSYFVVHGDDFSQGIQNKMQDCAITVSIKENPNIKKRRDEYLSPRVSYFSKYLGHIFNFG